MSELQYSRERAKFIVKQFDKNNDGKLSAREMERFKDSVKQTLGYTLTSMSLTDLFIQKLSTQLANQS